MECAMCKGVGYGEYAMPGVGYCSDSCDGGIGMNPGIGGNGAPDGYTALGGALCGGMGVTSGGVE